MNAVIFCFPVIVAIFLLIFFRKKVTLWEYAVLVIPSVLIAIFVEFCMKEYNTNDTEYLGYYVTKVTHYDPWDEYIRRTCTKQVPSGVDSNGRTKYRTVTYDCSYVDYHPDRWTMFTNDNDEIDISETEFNKIKKQFNTPSVFRDMFRRYHRRDGDAQDYYWDNNIQSLVPLTVEHLYENRIQASKSIFKIKKVNKTTKENLGLFDYPDVNKRYQETVLGIDLPKSQTQYIDALNALYGKDEEIRMFMLFFPDSSPDVMEYQKSYWSGGNKNEVVICVGYDSKTKEAIWCEGFSWSDIPLIESKSKQFFIDNPKIDLKAYYEYITPFIEVGWDRKSWTDFNYINVELSQTQYMWIFIFVALYSICISLWIVTNEYNAD